LLRLVEGNKVTLSASQNSELPTRADAAASFQEAVIDVLVAKAVAVARECRVQQILLVGGVASNEVLRHWLVKSSPVPVLVPEPVLCTDNAAMIAACGYYRFQAGETDRLNLDVFPSLKLV
jgi:N6-L-threonylcarbamoyladenine synthase